MGLDDLPNTKWDLSGSQPICKEDFQFIEEAILESGGGGGSGLPPLVYVDVASLKVAATSDSPAKTFMSGFPNIINGGEYLTAGLTDKKQRTNTADVSFNFGISSTLWGIEKNSQLYAMFAVAEDDDAVFTLKAMPFITVLSDISSIIVFGTHEVPATPINYGFTGDEFVGGYIYVLSGAQRGVLRLINDSTDTIVGYNGGSLGLNAGDTIIILPPGVNFQYLGCFFNNSSGNIINTKAAQDHAFWAQAGTFFWIITAPVSSIKTLGCGGGGGGGSDSGGQGGSGGETILQLPYVSGSLLKIIIGPGGTGGATPGGDGGVGGNTYLDSYLIGLGGGGGSSGVPGGGYPALVYGDETGYFGTGGLPGGPAESGDPGTNGCLTINW